MYENVRLIFKNANIDSTCLTVVLKILRSQITSYSERWQIECVCMQKHFVAVHISFNKLKTLKNVWRAISRCSLTTMLVLDFTPILSKGQTTPLASTLSPTLNLVHSSCRVSQATVHLRGFSLMICTNCMTDASIYAIQTWAAVYHTCLLFVNCTNIAGFSHESKDTEKSENFK